MQNRSWFPIEKSPFSTYDTEWSAKSKEAFISLVLFNSYSLLYYSTRQEYSYSAHIFIFIPAGKTKYPTIHRSILIFVLKGYLKMSFLFWEFFPQCLGYSFILEWMLEHAFLAISRLLAWPEQFPCISIADCNIKLDGGIQRLKRCKLA